MRKFLPITIAIVLVAILALVYLYGDYKGASEVRRQWAHEHQERRRAS